jgi:hypothetical protein
MRNEHATSSSVELLLRLLALVTGGAAPIFALLIATTVGLSAPPMSPDQMAMMPQEMVAMKLQNIMWPDQAAMMLQMPDVSSEIEVGRAPN